MVTIDEATVEDSTKIAGLWSELAFEMEQYSDLNTVDFTTPEELTEHADEKFNELLHSKLTYYAFLATKNNEPIGFADFTTQTSDVMVANKNIFIRNLYVQQPHRNNGIGTKLLNKITEYAHSFDVQYITIPVEWNNKKAISLYEKLGYNKKQIRLTKTINK